MSANPASTPSPTLTGATPAPRGRVIFVGTGPGDPDLLTLGAVAALADAIAVVIEDEELTAILEHPAVKVNPSAEVQVISPRANQRQLTPLQRARAVLNHACDGSRVVRLVKGDPFMDAGVAEEAAECVKGGIEFEIVPGVSSLTAVPEYAGISLNTVDGMHFVTVGETFTKSQAAHWALAGTLVINARAGMVADIAAATALAGRVSDDPAMVIISGGSTAQTTIPSTLAGLADAVAAAGVDDYAHVHVVIGPGVAENEQELSWYESKPLFGWRVLVPRTKDQAGPMTNRLRSYGASSEEVPTISVEPPRSPQQMEKAIRGLVEGRYEWVAFTSVNAVKAVRERFEAVGLDARDFSGLKVAAVGRTTAKSLQDWGIEPDLIPVGDQSAAGLAAEFPPYDEVLDPINRVFLPRADIATETLSAALVELGWEVEDVTAYRTVRASPP
ncbi:MAG: bifunctional uroporphyrinogen-III C-methyltransferase/uroporphyrinogen-III synthase, partial [Propionibacterium sp.]|nr:bifunctional uroporphyrinogen-III C-methyltransferase/uroporphyrinogen-III synthase [Propionibacterium sp.]